MRLSVVIPIHDMPNFGFFFDRCLKSLESQSFQDFETVIVKEGKFAENTNAGIRKAKGELIKFLCLDDWLIDENYLQKVVDNFEDGWLVTASDNNLNPHYNEQIYLGVNTLGSPSALTIKNDKPLFFDKNLVWLVDCEYYERLWNRYGNPTILKDAVVGVGIGDHQMTHQISDEIKVKEQLMMKEKYG